MSPTAIVRPFIGGVAILVLFAPGNVARGEVGNQSANIVAVSGRPLADAIQELQRRHGWLVTYEDSFYEFMGDVSDVTASVRRDGKTEPKVFVPRERRFQFNYQQGDVARPREVLAALLNAYHASAGTTDGFDLLQDGSVYHVVPTSARNAEGAVVKRQSRLDVRITLPEARRNLYETVEAILQEANRPKLGIGGAPVNLLRQRSARLSARDEVARDVLVRTLAASGSRVSWRLLCQPLEPNYCLLNLQRLDAPTL